MAEAASKWTWTTAEAWGDGGAAGQAAGITWEASSKVLACCQFTYHGEWYRFVF